VATPQVRSSWTKFVIAHAKAAPEPQRTQLLSALAPLRATIREAGLISWVDATVHAQVCARLVAGLGEAAALEFWAELLVEAAGKSLLKPIVGTALALHGRDPASLVRNGQRVWALVTRDCGTLVVDTKSERRAALSLEGLPEKLRTLPVLICLQGSILGCARAVDLSGRCLRDASLLGDGSARITLSW